MRNMRLVNTTLLIISVALGALMLSSGAACQNANAVDFDAIAAEQHFRDETAYRYVFSKSLHEAEWNSDGTRGFGLPNPTATRVAIKVEPPFATEIELRAFYDYCYSEAIVLATNLDSTPILSSDKKLIYTVSHFAVVDTIKGDASLNPGQRLVAYRLGGTVNDAGETLRIDTPDMAAFELQHLYILHLTRDKSATARQYSLPQMLTITVADGRVDPIKGKYAWFTGAEDFPSGTAYTEIKNTFARVAELKSCP